MIEISMCLYFVRYLAQVNPKTLKATQPPFRMQKENAASKKKDKSGQEVERRASKGRKIRYVPIEKLQNFMASRPRPTNIGFEHNTGAMDALIRSLFSGTS